MKLYRIDDSYINFLKQYDRKVSENKEERRPYVGVVVKIGDIKYYAPLSSPKSKHLKMRNSKDFRKIAGGKYGAINFCNMIPVPDYALHCIDIKKEQDYQYRKLLAKQYQIIKNDWDNIQKTAYSLRQLIFKENFELKFHDLQIKKRCCDLVLLEKMIIKFNK